MADRDKLFAYPIVEDIEYRQASDSEQLNKMLRSIEESILRTIIRSNQIKEKQDRLVMGAVNSYKSMAINKQIYESYPEPVDMSGELGGILYASAFDDVDVTNGKRNSSAGIVTMSWNNENKVSKIPVYENKVSPSINIFVDDELRGQDDPVYNIINNDDTDVWIESATSGSHTLEIQLPPSTRKTFNYLEINPFPIFGIEITDIEYYDLNGITHNIVPKDECPFYNSSGPLIFHLEPREFNNTVKISFNVKDNINVMGFSSIDISSINYNDNKCTCYFKFEGFKKDVEEIEPDTIDLDFYINGVIKSNYDRYIEEISLVNDKTNPTTTISLNKKKSQDINSSSINTGSNQELWLKVVMNEVNLTTPIFRGAKLKYTYEE